MTQAVTGKSGAVLFGSGAVLEVKAFQFTPDMNTPDVTSMDSGGWGEYADGIKTWAGSFESLVCADLHGSRGMGSFRIGTAATASTPIYYGTIIIKGPAVNVDVAGEVRYSYQFQGTGPYVLSLGA